MSPGIVLTLAHSAVHDLAAMSAFSAKAESDVFKKRRVDSVQRGSPTLKHECRPDHTKGCGSQSPAGNRVRGLKLIPHVHNQYQCSVRLDDLHFL